jgi:drug/metabolite transporter (DMT)-like permease
VSRSLKAHVLLVVVTVIWGATFVLIKDALADISPLLFNAIRITMAAGCLLLIFRKEMAQLTRGALRAGVAVGIFLWLGFEFQTTGLKFTTPSKSAFITGFSVVLVPLLVAAGCGAHAGGGSAAAGGGAPQARRTLNRWTAIGAAAALAGLYFLTVPAPATAGAQSSLGGINFGDVLTLGCALGFAGQIIVMARATARFPFQQIATVEALVCAGLMILTAPVLEKPYVHWSPTVLAAILVTALFGTGAAFTIQAWAQQFTPPAHTAVIFALEPVFAWITSFLVLHERLGMRATWGALVILGGVLLSELKGSQESGVRS